jgi:hypothetical protein
MPKQFPADITQWVTAGGVWRPADATVVLVHYTNATLFVNNGTIIDGRATGLSDKEFEALKARYPDAVVKVNDNLFTLPFVPVGTVVDITPLSDAAPRAK